MSPALSAALSSGLLLSDLLGCPAVAVQDSKTEGGHLPLPTLGVYSHPHEHRHLKVSGFLACAYFVSCVRDFWGQ